MNCDDCKHYEWYYDRCRKWNCEVDAREIHNCFEQRETPVRDAIATMVADISKSLAVLADKAESEDKA